MFEFFIVLLSRAIHAMQGIIRTAKYREIWQYAENDTLLNSQNNTVDTNAVKTREGHLYESNRNSTPY